MGCEHGSMISVVSPGSGRSAGTDRSLQLGGWCLLLLLSAPKTGVAHELAVATWPQWRGPARDGRVAQTGWPQDLSSLTELWRQPLGPSYSGPIVTEDLVITTETQDKKLEVVRAFDRASGKPEWTAQWEGAMQVPFFAKANGDWIRSTPAYDGRRLYVAGMRDVLVCLDAATGQRVWDVDFVKSVGSPLPQFGFVSSPLVLGEHVFVQAGASLVKLDKLTGAILWRSLRDAGGMEGSAFSSPVLATLDDQPQLVVQTRSQLAGVEIETGRELWSHEVPSFRGMNILPPTIVGNGVFTSSYGGRTYLFGTKAAGGDFHVNETWSNKSQGYMSSPVVIDKHAYLHLRNQRLTCIDLTNGAIQWTTPPFGKYWSMVVSGDQILALDEQGELLHIRANPAKFELLDRREVSQHPTWAHLAVCNEEVFIRDLSGISVYRWGQRTSRP